MQVKTFQPIYDGKDLIAQARTGTGKTFSFALPLTEKLQSVSQDGRRGRSPKVTYHLSVNTKTLEYGSFQKWFCNCFGDFFWTSFSFIGVCNTECFAQIRSYNVTEVLQHHSDNTFHFYSSLWPYLGDCYPQEVSVQLWGWIPCLFSGSGWVSWTRLHSLKLFLTINSTVITEGFWFFIFPSCLKTQLNGCKWCLHFYLSMRWNW